METSRIRHDAESRVREEIRTIQAINFGGDTIIGKWDVNPSAQSFIRRTG